MPAFAIAENNSGGRGWSHRLTRGMFIGFLDAIICVVQIEIFVVRKNVIIRCLL